MAVYVVQAVRTWVREMIEGWNSWWRGWVIWVWLIFIGFLAANDEGEEDFRSLREAPVHEEEVVSRSKEVLEKVPPHRGRLDLLSEEPEEPNQEEPIDDGLLGGDDVKEGDGSWPRGGIAQESNLVRYKAFENLDSPQLEEVKIEVKKIQKEALFSQRKDIKEVSPLRKEAKEVFPTQKEKNEVFPTQREKKELSPALQDVVTALSKVEENGYTEKEKEVFEEEESFDDQIDDPSKDVVWRNLLEKYASEAQHKERERDEPSFEEDTSQGEIATTVEEIVEKYVKRYGDSDEERDESKDLSAEEFTSRVGKKLEEYLAQVEEPSDDDDNLSDEDYPVEVTTNTVIPDIMELDNEGDDLKDYLEGPIDGNGRIFILIEDEEQNKNGREHHNELRGFRLEKINEGEEPEIENEFIETEERPRETEMTINKSAPVIEDEVLLKDEDFKPKEKGHFFDRNVSYIDDEDLFFEDEKENLRKYSEKEEKQQEFQEMKEALRVVEEEKLSIEEARDEDQGRKEDLGRGKESVVTEEERESESATIEEEEADETDLSAKKPQIFKDQGFNAFVTIIGCSEDYYDEGEIPSEKGVDYDMKDKFVEEEQEEEEEEEEEEEGFWEDKEEEDTFEKELKEEYLTWEEKEKMADLTDESEKEAYFKKGMGVKEEEEDEEMKETEGEKKEEEEEELKEEKEEEEQNEESKEEKEEEEDLWKDMKEEEEMFWKGARKDSLPCDEGREPEVIEKEEEIPEYEVTASEAPIEKQLDIMTEVMSEISTADHFGHESVIDIAEAEMKFEEEVASEEYEVASMGVAEVEEQDEGEHELVVEMEDDSMAMEEHKKAEENFEPQLRSVAAVQEEERKDEVIGGFDEIALKLDSAVANEVFEVPEMSVVEVEHNRGLEDETVGELDYEKLKRDKSAEAEESFELPRQSVGAAQEESQIRQEFAEEMDEGIGGLREEAIEVFEGEAKSVVEVEEQEKMVAEVVRGIDPFKLPASSANYIKYADAGKMVAKVEVQEELKGDEIMGFMKDFQLEVDFAEDHKQHTDPDPTLMATMDEVEVLEMKEPKEEVKPKKDSEKQTEGPVAPKRAKKSEEENNPPTKSWKKKEAETKEDDKEEKALPQKTWKKKEVNDSKDELKDVFGKLTKIKVYGEKATEPAKPLKKTVKKPDELKAPGSKVVTKKPGESKKGITPEEPTAEPVKVTKKWSKKEEAHAEPKEIPSKTVPSWSKKKEAKTEPKKETKKTTLTSPEKDTEGDDFWANFGKVDDVEDEKDLWKDTTKKEAEADDDGEDFWAAMNVDDDIPVKPKRPSWVEEVVSEKKLKSDDQEVPSIDEGFLKKGDKYDADLQGKDEEEEEEEIDEELKDLLVPKTEPGKKAGSKLAALTGVEDVLDLKVKRKSPVASNDSKVEDWLKASDKTKSYVSPLSEVEDLLVPKEPRNLTKASDKKDKVLRQPDKDFDKFMNMGTKLTDQEEKELKAYLAEDKKDVKEIEDLDQYLALSDDLTKQEKEELEAYRKEKEEIHQARMKELEKYFDMPVGLTEEEQWEFEEYLSQKETTDDSAMDTDDRLLSMPLGVSGEMVDLDDGEKEEEEEDEANFQTDEEYRQYIRERYLRQLDLEYLRLAEEEYGYDEYAEYDEDYEYEEYDDDDYELEDEEMEVEDLGEDEKPKAAPRMVDEAVSTDAVAEKTPEARKKSGLFKLKKEGSSENLESKKFFRFGSFGNKKKKMGSRASSEDSGENQVGAAHSEGFGLKSEGSPKAPIAPRRKKKGLAEEEVSKTVLAGRSPLLKKARRKIVAPNSQKTPGTTAEKQLGILQESVEEAGEKQEHVGEKESEHLAPTTSPVRINRSSTHQSKTSQLTPCRPSPHHCAQHHHNQHPYNPGSHVTTKGKGYNTIGPKMSDVDSDTPMEGKAYKDEEEGWPGNEDEDDVPSSRLKKNEEEDEEQLGEDEDEDAARTAFLMKMAEGYEGEEREAVEAFIRSKLEQEKVEKATAEDEENKAPEDGGDEGEKKKKKKKRSEGGEKKSRKKKKKSDDKLYELFEWMTGKPQDRTFLSEDRTRDLEVTGIREQKKSATGYWTASHSPQLVPPWHPEGSFTFPPQPSPATAFLATRDSDYDTLRRLLEDEDEDEEEPLACFSKFGGTIEYEWWDGTRSICISFLENKKIPEDVEESCSASSSHSSPSSTASCSSGPEDSENDEIVPKIEVDLVESRCSEEIASEIYEDEPLREESFSEREDEVEEEEEEEEEYDESHSLTNGHSTEAQSYTNGHHASTSDECPDEELLNVNVKKLTSAYLHSASNDDSARSSGSEGRGGQPPKEEVVRPSVSIHELMDAYTSPTKTAPSKQDHPRIDKELPPQGTLHSRLNAYSAVAQTYKPVTSKEEINVGVSFSSLKNAYVQSANKSRPDGQASDKDLNGAPSPLKEEVNLNVSLTQLRETYCNTARSSSARDDANSASSPASKTSPVVSTGVKIKDLTRSWSDLSQAGRDKMAGPNTRSAISSDHHIFSRVSVKELRRSYSDLTRITATSTTTTAAAEDRFEKRGRENDTDSYRISVRELRASYGDLSRLADSPPIPVGRTRTPSPSPRSRSFGVMSRSTSHQNLGSGQQPHSLPPCHTFSTHSSSPSSSFKNTHKSWEPKQQLQLSSRASSMVELGGRRSKEVGVGVSDVPRGGLKEPIYTGVSVAQLKRSYCDLARTQAPSLKSPPKTPDLQWVEGSVQRMCAAFSTPPPPSPQPSSSPSQRRRIITGVNVAHMKAAYNRDDLYEKHVGPRIRSFDASKMKSKFEKPKAPSQLSSDCRMCGKQVFQMEKIVAEKATWHKNCFRCKECNKNLTLETYQSHEGTLYCKPHFKELFRPKAVVEDEATARKDRLSRRPRMIVLESQPEELPDDVVRASDKPDYGLEELQTNVRAKFAMFETASKEEEQAKLEPVSVRRSQSLLNRVARFQRGESGEEYGVENSELGEYDEDEDDEEEEEEEFDDENADPDIVRPKKKKKERPVSIGNMGDLKAAWETKNRREEMAQNRKEELAKFRQMLCAGKNLTLKEMFESGAVDGEKMDKSVMREEIKIDGKRAASSLKEKFEKGRPFTLEDEDNEERKANGEREEVEEIFKEAETAHKARNIFKQIDSHVTKEGLPVMRSQSFAQGVRENRLSKDMSQHCLYSRPENQSAEVIKANEEVDDFHVETSDLASRFKFFATYEDRLKEESKKNRKVFRVTPPRDGTVKGLGGEDQEIGRDPNLIRCSDNYQDDVDCKNTRNVLAMFKKMELQGTDDGDEGPKPLKRFTPPPDGEYDDDDDEEYSDEEYSDEEYSDEEDEDEEDSESGRKPKYQDEVLEMAKQARKKSPQSAKKAASLRAKFERWESDQNEANVPKDGDEECMPSIDTAKNLKAMFETKAQEVLLPKVQQPKVKVNRFVGGGGEKCIVCDKTVYAMEKLELQGKILHKSCFRCGKCNTKLSMGSFSMGGDRMYCTTHYKQLFAEKGTYEVFSPNGSGKWARKIEATPNNEETEPKSNS
ncbi:uncharacterized protein LOC143039888 [Oratosquilla oratoria]|uniref:uncharacterized protein LOC143039888 n=1 Tax=Oratosquilla oratoria TaxID=337810 RepID=UPI003F76B7DB